MTSPEGLGSAEIFVQIGSIGPAIGSSDWSWSSKDEQDEHEEEEENHLEHSAPEVLQADDDDSWGQTWAESLPQESLSESCCETDQTVHRQETWILQIPKYYADQQHFWWFGILQPVAGCTQLRPLLT